MALFTSSPTESPFAPLNVLFDVASGQALQRGKMNDLLLLKQQQEIDDAASARKGVDAYVEQLNSSLAPAKAAKPVAGSFEQQLGASEGGNNPAAVNKGGYSGQFQFGAARLADLGIYKPAEGEDLSKNEWKGTFNLPPYNVTTHDQFLQSPAAQHAAFQQHVANIDQAIAATPGADKLDPNGLRAVAHLGGVQGMQRFIQTGGAYNPGDVNGTHLSDYYAKFAAGGVPALQQAFGDPQGRGVAARTGGVDVAGPGAPVPAQAALQAPAVGGLLPNGLTAEQTRDLTLRARMAAGRPDALAGVMSEADRLRATNQAQLHQAQQDAVMAAERAANRQHQTLEEQRQAKQDERQAIQDKALADERARKAEIEGSPFPGNTVDAASYRVLLAVGPKIQAGTATDAERMQYELAHNHIAEGKVEVVPDPTDPTGQRQMLGRVPGQVPPSFPAPDFRPGGAAPQPVGASVPVPAPPASPTAPVPGVPTAPPAAAMPSIPPVAQPGAAVPIPGTQKPPPVLTQDQARAATYADRMTASHQIMNQLDDAATSWAEARKQKIGDYLGYNINSPEYQKVKQAQENFVNASLRLESGAVINPDEFNRAAKQYFPQPGDSAAVIEQKRKNREAQITGFTREAGPSYKAPSLSGGQSSGSRPPLSSFQR